MKQKYFSPAILKKEEPVTYSNLTQNLEGSRFTYLRSTDVEQMNWKRLLWSVSDELLYFLSERRTIIITDLSSNGKGKIERIFCPVFNDLINLIYFEDVPKHLFYKAHLDRAAREMMGDKGLMSKYNFWKKRFVQNYIDGFRPIFICNTLHVEKEPNPLEKGVK